MPAGVPVAITSPGAIPRAGHLTRALEPSSGSRLKLVDAAFLLVLCEEVFTSIAHLTR